MPHPGPGRHRYDCACGQVHFAWHSCNHRLCPQCGAADNAEWVGQLVTFTLSSELRPIALQKSEVIEAFFRQSKEALAGLLADPKRTGGFLHARGKATLQWLQTALNARLLKREKKTPTPKPVYHCPLCGSIMERTNQRSRAPPAERNRHFLATVAA